MVKTLEAVFDGTVLHPVEPLVLTPNTRLWVTIETLPPEEEKGAAYSFLRMARSLHLDGPPDWATNIKEYLYGGKAHTIDCVSFVVMRERGITEALTSDRHFLQAGFRTLLRDG